MKKFRYNDDLPYDFPKVDQKKAEKLPIECDSLLEFKRDDVEKALFLRKKKVLSSKFREG